MDIRQIEPIAISPFAKAVAKLFDNGVYKGEKLDILGQEYFAWTYDTYIYEAIQLAAKWPIEYVTYDRIEHLRYWIRENVQHGHNLPTASIKSFKTAREFIDLVTEAEYEGMENGEEFKQDQLQLTARIFNTAEIL